MDTYTTYPQCGGCGAPRQSTSHWCRYCSAWIGTEKELARAVALTREIGSFLDRPVRPTRPAPAPARIRTMSLGPQGRTGPADVRVAAPARRTAPTTSVLDAVAEWAIQAVCVAIVGIPSVLVLWAILTAAMSQ